MHFAEPRPEVRDALAINGGHRVPVAVFLSEDGYEVARYGERTVSRARAKLEEALSAAPRPSKAPTCSTPTSGSRWARKPSRRSARRSFGSIAGTAAIRMACDMFSRKTGSSVETFIIARSSVSGSRYAASSAAGPR